jgi:replicative DNA helicase
MVNSDVPPNDPQAEESLLACMIIDPTIIVDVAAKLRGPDDFWRVPHQQVYRAMLDLRQSDPAVLVDELERRGQLGDSPKNVLHFEMFNWARDLPNAYGWEALARVVKDHAIRREAIHAAFVLRDMATDPTRTNAECIAALNSTALALAESAVVSRDQAAAEVADESLALFEAGGIQSMTTTYQGLDKIGGGFVPGGLYVVAARPGEGKSALIGNMIERYQRKGVKCGVIPLEMTNQQMMVRLVAVRANLNSRLLREAKITGDERARAIEEWKTLRDGIWFQDKPGQTVIDVAAQARLWKRKHGIDIVFVDYLQIMGASDPTVERRLQIGEMTRGLKMLARELGIPVIVASQINREAESRRKADGTGGKPGLQNLKEAGNIEEDADGVIGIYRPLEPKADAPTWAAEVGWMKNRHGGIGHAHMAYQRASTRFTEATNDDVQRDEGSGFSRGANGQGRERAAVARGNADASSAGGVSEEQRRKNLEAFGAPRERRDLA